MLGIEHCLLPVVSFYPQVLAEGRGSYVYDTDGKQYLDLNAGQFCSILGNQNPDLMLFLQENLNKPLHTNTEMITEETVKASIHLNQISGEMDGYSVLLSTGAESIEFCLRYAKHLKKKNGIVCFNKGYHGLTLGAQSVTFGGIYADPVVNKIFPVTIPECHTEDEVQLEEQSIQELRSIFEAHSNEIAAVLMEPLASVGGMLMPSKQYFRQVRELCSAYDVLLIFDECQTGFGRTGTWFYFQQLGMVPDMLACAKGAGLGFPAAFAMFRKELAMEQYQMTHYSSHQNDGFAAMILNFGIQYIQEKGILESNRKKGAAFLAALQKLEGNCSRAGNARGRGLMLGLDLYFKTEEDSRQYYRRLTERALEEGIILQGTNAGRVLRFLPDYLITEDEIRMAAEKLGKLLCEEQGMTG